MFCFAFRNQLFYFITAFLTCQALFYFYFAIAYRDNFLTISHSQVFVNNLFKFFWTFYFVLFFKKRRKRDLNPRAGCPTYTLSRGASSASWVFLRICFRYRRCIKRIIDYTKAFFKCQQLFLLFCNLSFTRIFSHFSLFVIYFYIDMTKEESFCVNSGFFFFLARLWWSTSVRKYFSLLLLQSASLLLLQFHLSSYPCILHTTSVLKSELVL